jgi:tetratricopeptide (TPR) repeat protein
MYKQALEHAEMAVRIAPHDAMAHRNLAQIFDAMGNTRDAVSHNRQAIVRGPGKHGITDPPDALAYRRAAVQSVAMKETQRGHAHANYDAYRALMRKPYVVATTEQTNELLARTRTNA